MRSRWTLGGMMLVIALIGTGLGLLATAQRKSRLRVMEEHAMAVQARYAVQQAMLAVRPAVQSEPSAGQSDRDDNDSLRRENEALRAKLRELERKLTDRPEPAPAAASPLVPPSP